MSTDLCDMRLSATLPTPLDCCVIRSNRSYIGVSLVRHLGWSHLGFTGLYAVAVVFL